MVPAINPDDLPIPLEDLLKQARAGSADALGRLLELCRPYLLHIAGAELPHALQAKLGASVLVQDTFLEAQRIFDRFQGSAREELLAWLRAILRNKLATSGRQFQATEKRDLAREVTTPDSQPGRDLPADVSTPSQAVMRDEQGAAVVSALERLPEHYRQVIVWRQWEDLPFDEIARRLGRGVDAARMIWWRAVEKLQQELEPPS